MQHVAPLGPVYQAGTLSGNPVAMAVGYETVKRLTSRRRGIQTVHQSLEEKGRFLQEGIENNIRELKVAARVNRVGSMFSLFFTGEPVENLEAASRARAELFAPYFEAMLSRGIYLAPSPHEAGFISAAHTEEDLAKTIEANYAGLRAAFA